MSNTFGNALKITVFGQSHSEAIGVVIDGLPAGFSPDMEKAASLMARRAPGKNSFSTARKEEDIPKIISGLYNGRTCGAPLCAVIDNKDVRSKDYENLRSIPRPSHADYTANVKFNGMNDIRGGGQFSGRLTAPLCFAGALCLQLLERENIFIGAHLLELASVRDHAPDSTVLTSAELQSIAAKVFPVFSDECGELMQKAILDAREDGDSVGGIIRCYALGLPAGLGDPMFDGLESLLSSVIFSIPAVRGVSFGAGFEAARMRGSQHNDEFINDCGVIRTKTNKHGGVLGGISSGMPLVIDVAMKPTPSIAKPQASVDLSNMQESLLKIEGRHDPCIAPRAVPVLEAVTAAVILDLMLKGSC